MGIYNRLLDLNKPADWDSTHENPPNMDAGSWKLAIHPFTDMILLYIQGDLGTGATALGRVQELFDLSATERQQFVEVYQNFINGANDAERIQNLMRFQSILRAMERGIPQRYAPNPQAWLYNKLGVTTADDR